MREKVVDMMQALLADRFKMKLHRDTKVPVYGLVAAKGGLKLKESPPDVDADTANGRRGGTTVNFGKDPTFRCGTPGSKARK